MGKRIAFVMYSNLSKGAGTERIAMQYCKNRRPGWEMAIFQTDKSAGNLSDYAVRLEKTGVKVITFTGYDQKFAFLARNYLGGFLLWCFVWPFLFALLNLFPEYAKLKQELQTYDIVYVFGNYFSTLIPEGPIVVGSTHGWGPKSTGLVTRFLTLLISKRLWWHRINVFHLYVRYSWFMKSGRQSFAIDNGVDTDYFYPLNVKSASQVVKFVFMARLEECKGCERVLTAFENVSKGQRATLSVMGAGPLEKLFKSAPGINFYGFVDRKKQSEILRESDCFVYPTSCDTFALVVLEALASGLYVITSDHLRGVFDEFEKIGILEYCVNDPQVIASRMRLFSSKVLDPSIVSRAQELIRSRYSWDNISNDLFENFNRLILDKSIPSLAGK